MLDGSFWQDQLADVFGGHRWLIAMDVLVATNGRVRLLNEWGADRPFVLAGFRGLGPVPSEDDCEIAVLDVKGETMLGSIRAAEAGFDDPGPEISARIEAWDPDRSARVLGTIFATGQDVLGRPYWGGRPESWIALEDKVVAEDIWDRAGVERAPAEVVSADLSALTAAAVRVDLGAGTVWAGDMREGFNGGAEYVRWVRSERDTREAARFFAEHCDLVRVMPFLDGVPCSIHGMVFDDEVIAIRPCEMVVLRQLASARFRYASAATFWEPEEACAEQMRDVARRVGAHLRERVGYRGAFTVDGVLTRDGFRPTELNPRIGAALAGLAAGIDNFPLTLLNLALVAGEELDWRPRELEKLLLAGSRENRRGTASVVIDRPILGERTAQLAYAHGRCRPVELDEPVAVEVGLGPGPAGGFLRVRLDPDTTPVGPSVAPRVVAALAWADTTWNLGIGQLQAAPDLRPGVAVGGHG